MTVFKGSCGMWYKIFNHLSCMHQSHSDVKVKKSTLVNSGFYMKSKITLCKSKLKCLRSDTNV